MVIFMETKIRSTSKSSSGGDRGKLRIGDNWNAITIIALSQTNPLKAIAEFVENSIDARARNITIIRGKEKGELYLKVIDDGEGIPLNKSGLPDFKYVATHICDSIKRRLKREGIEGIQGEFGIGLLSFWTVGERLMLSSSGEDGRTYQMIMQKNEPSYIIHQRRLLFSHPGTELVVRPLLAGIRHMNGERIQRYLASELRDRIRKSGVKIKIKDRQSRKEFEVKPRQFTGRLLHSIITLQTEQGEIYPELYLNSPSPENMVSLYRSGTRVLHSISKLDFFNREPWTSGYLQGMIDAPFLQLTPGTRDGIVQDESFLVFCTAVESIQVKLQEIIEEEKKAEEEEASRHILKSVQRALKEAFLILSRDEYDWFDVYAGVHKPVLKNTKETMFPENGVGVMQAPRERDVRSASASEDKEFFEYAGPLYRTMISPASSIIRVNTSKMFHCISRDRNRRIVDINVDIDWNIKEGEGSLSDTKGELVTFTAPAEPGITILQVTVIQGDVECHAESIVTVTESLIEKSGGTGEEPRKGIPGYTFLRAPGELWRSRYDEKNNLIIINNGHGDYLYAAKKRTRKIKYICRLFSKELVLRNFKGFDSGELLERMIELSLYTEENLR
jgi:hypothetical protein